MGAGAAPAAGVLNLRDVGGLRAADGARVRPGVLWRGATPAFVDAGQARRLVEEVGVRARADLRGDAEVAEETSADLLAAERGAGWSAVHLPVRSGGHLWSALDGVRGTDALQQAVATHYAGYLAHSGASVAAVARLVLDPDRRPVLVHCTAGKDRTGVVVAVLLSAVGVLDDEVVADYARTSEAMPALREQFTALPAFTERLAALPEEAFGSEPGTMRLLLAHLAAAWGGARGYLAAQGLDAAELDALGVALLEPAPGPVTG